MGQLKQWREQNWVRIGTDGKIKGPCGTSKDKKKRNGKSFKSVRLQL